MLKYTIFGVQGNYDGNRRIMISSQTIQNGRRFFGFVAAMVLLCVCGCGDFFAQKPTEIQTKDIFRELSRVNVVSDVDRPLPALYTAGPKIVSEKDGAKLFYFTRHNSPALLAGLIKEQLDYLVSQNPATNQLVVKCPNKEEADVVLRFLNEVDVAPIQVKIDCVISEIFADLTMDYETTLEIEDLFGERITLGSFMPGASMRAPGRKGIGLEIGISQDEFRAVIDVLESRGYAKILMHPTVEVVNGTTARIETKERVPIQEKILSEGALVETVIYQDVIDYLDVTPRVYSDGTIGLKTAAGISSRTIPEGVTQAPIITTREIKNEENRIRKGHSLIIGGIVKTERVSVIRGVPFLRDLPVLGIIFSSKDFEDRAKEILFILTPSISINGSDHAEMIERIRAKHARPEYKAGIEEVFTDPFGTGVYNERIKTSEVSKQLEQIEAELDRIETSEDADQIKEILIGIKKTLREMPEEKKVDD